MNKVSLARAICREALKKVKAKNSSLIFNKDFLKAIRKTKYKLFVDSSLPKRFLGGASRLIWIKYNDPEYYKELVSKYKLKIKTTIIKINPILFKTKYIKHLSVTVTHELAHVIDFNFRGNSWHDATWKSIHKLLGGDGKATSYIF